MTTAPTFDLRRLGEFLDRLPIPLVLVEPGTARTLYASPAAQGVGGLWPAMANASEHEVFEIYDEHGARLTAEQMPAVRAARGERFRHVPYRCVVGGEDRWLSVTVDGVDTPDGNTVAVITFDDVTEIRVSHSRERGARIQFEAMLENVADAVTAQGPDGRLLYANGAALRLLGYETQEQLLGAPVDEVRGRFQFFTEERDPFPLENLPGRRALMGERPEPAVVRFRPAGGGPEGWARVKAQPICDAAGNVVMAINLIEDITSIKQAEYSQRFLAEAGRVLASSLDYEATLRSVAALAVPEIADWCVIYLKADDELERVGVAHRDPEMVRFAEEVGRRYPPDPAAERGVYPVLRTAQPELYPEIGDEILQQSAQDAEHLELLRQVGMSSAMVVPVTAHGQVLGAITMVASESGRHFDADDLALAEELGLRAGTAIENARLYRQRSEIARTLQASLLPPSLPDIERLRAGAVFRPAGEGFDVGGDFYDLFSTDESHWYAVIGDVCGKGAEAAATTALIRYTVRAAAVRRRSPAGILQWLNDAMLRQDTGPTSFCTLVVARLEIGASGRIRCQLSSAGHPLPRVIRADHTVEAVGSPGTLMGVTSHLDLSDVAFQLARGDTLVLYTDGLTEARAPQRVWSPDDLDAALAGAAAAARDDPSALVELVTLHALGDATAPTRDDIALLALTAA